MREDIFIPEHKTRVLPLRWLANYVFHPISMFFFKMGLRMNDKLEWDNQYKWYNRAIEWFGWNFYKIFDKPYTWWGTVYKFEGNIGDLGGSGWDDYDENGIPYWDYFWHEDEETGDGWRLVPVKPSEYTDERDGSIIPEIQKDMK